MSTVFTGSGDARARAFDAESGALQRVFRGHAFIINCIQVGAPCWLSPGPRSLKAEPGRALPSPPALEGGEGKESRSPRPQYAMGRPSSPKPRSPGLTRPHPSAVVVVDRRAHVGACSAGSVSG